MRRPAPLVTTINAVPGCRVVNNYFIGLKVKAREQAAHQPMSYFIEPFLIQLHCLLWRASPWLAFQADFHVSSPHGLADAFHPCQNPVDAGSHLGFLIMPNPFFHMTFASSAIVWGSSSPRVMSVSSSLEQPSSRRYRGGRWPFPQGIVMAKGNGRCGLGRAGMGDGRFIHSCRKRLSRSLEACRSGFPAEPDRASTVPSDFPR